MTIALFHPQVTCAETVSTPPSSCRYIIDEMLKTTNVEFLGHATDPSVTVALPLTLQARKRDLKHIAPLPPKLSPWLTYAWVVIADGKCQFVIDTEGLTVRARWWDVWQALEATMAVCIRDGKGGNSKVPCE